MIKMADSAGSAIFISGKPLLACIQFHRPAVPVKLDTMARADV